MVEQLTSRERQILSLIASGKTTKQIARTLDISFKTAVSHRYSAQAKLGAKNAAEMVCLAARMGLIDISGGTAASPRSMVRHSEIIAEQLKVREDLRASLQTASTLRQRSSELLGELQTAREHTRSLVTELRATARVSKNMPAEDVRSLTSDTNAASHRTNHR